MRWWNGLFLIVAAIQFAVPISMIARREQTLAHGRAYRVRLSTTWPLDVFRGSSLDLHYDIETVDLTGSTETYERGETIFLALEEDPEGFAVVGTLRRSPPATGDYLEATVLFTPTERLRRPPASRDEVAPEESVPTKPAAPESPPAVSGPGEPAAAEPTPVEVLEESVEGSSRVDPPLPPPTLQLRLPFDRFYLDESWAGGAREALRSARRHGLPIWALVRVGDGRGVLEDLYVDGIALSDLATEKTSGSP
jgi:uncharacterized membrane-anchored protein